MLHTQTRTAAPATPFNLLPIIAADEVTRTFNTLEDRARRRDFLHPHDLLVEASVFVADHLTAFAAQAGTRSQQTITRAIYLARRARRLELAIAALR